MNCLSCRWKIWWRSRMSFPSARKETWLWISSRSSRAKAADACLLLMTSAVWPGRLRTETFVGHSRLVGKASSSLQWVRCATGTFISLFQLLKLYNFFFFPVNTVLVLLVCIAFGEKIILGLFILMFLIKWTASPFKNSSCYYHHIGGITLLLL